MLWIIIIRKKGLSIDTTAGSAIKIKQKTIGFFPNKGPSLKKSNSGLHYTFVGSMKDSIVCCLING